MLFHLLFELKEYASPLNVFRYPSFRVLVAFGTSLAITYSLYPWFIRQLQRRQIGQVIREELDANHQSKSNTPTMGGILLIFAALIATLLWSDLTNHLVWIAVGVTVFNSGVGFVDDALKLGKRGSKGLSEKGKLLGQFAVAIGAITILFMATPVAFSTELHVPFVSVDRFTLTLPVWVYIGFAAFVIAGAANAVNLTDGLDGLAIGPVIVGAGTWGLLAYFSATVFTVPVVVEGTTVTASFELAEYLMIPQVEGAQELAIFCAAIAGAGVGFLWYNTFPAQVFMGDVGSLGLGAALGTLAVLTKNELLCILIMGVPLLEAVSVIIQRYYFKLTGKRVFLMSPIHHHFEKKNWSESQIVVRFWIISILLCLLALASLKLR